MFELFYQYLIHYYKVVLPGLGTVTAQRSSAVSEFTAHTFLPPVYTFQLDQADNSPSTNFFVWLSGKLNIAEEEAALRVNDFVAELKKEINAGREVDWEGVGKIRRGMDSGIEFETVNKELVFEQKVFGEKVFHENSSHMVLVGDNEKNSNDIHITEVVQPPERKKFNSFHAALLIGIVALVVIIIYMSMHGWNPASTSSKNKLSPGDAPASYK